MKRFFHIFAVLGVTFGLCGVSFAQQATAPLTKIEFSIVGVTMSVGPEYQAVPKGIASQVTTGFVSNGDPISTEIAAMLPQDWRVAGELSGPSYAKPMTLRTAPGQPFQLPSFPALGKYMLSNLRIEDGTGRAIMTALPQTVTIESINDPLVTSVTTRQLTLQEIQDRGVVVDSTNFTAYEFTAAIGTESNRQPFTFPVLIPNQTQVQNLQNIPPPSEIGLPMEQVNALPPGLPDNISITGFVMEVEPDEKELTAGYTLPPIPGVMIIPGNIGFLNQYFSALLLVTNGAPAISNLVVKDLAATIILPPGEDMAPGTDAVPGDDPLRMAKGASGYFPRTMTVLHAGADGKYGTADDVSLLRPAESGQADFTIEGRKEGTHKIDFDIRATLDGLPIGPVTIKGKATGAVLVRNPDFSLTFGHPATIRSGEEYDFFITITNTSKSVANLVSTHLDPRAISGAALKDPADIDRRIETILPGSAATVKYRLVAQRTGKVTATAFASKDVAGRFILRMGVGELGIPLSPDSLIIPYTGSLPQDIVDAAVGLLGQAWSVATAPAGALPADVLPISKQIVTLRANDLAEAGLRILYGEQFVKAAQDLAFDFIGSDNAHAGFDSLRRRSTQGLSLNDALAKVFAADVQAEGVLGFQAGFADIESYRPGHISVITSEAPVFVQVSDAGGSRVGGLGPEDAFREMPYADQLWWSTECGVQSTGCTAAARSTLSLITKVGSASYRVDIAAGADASFDLGIVVPAASMLRQIRFSGVSLSSGARAWVELLPGADMEYVLNIDENADGISERIVSSSSVAIPDLGPRVVAATQMTPGFGPGGDKHGRNVAVLFSEPVTKETAQNILNYSVEENAVRMVYLQTSGRMAFLLLRDGIGPFFGSTGADGKFYGRTITVSGLRDSVGNGMDAPDTLPIIITAQCPAAVVSGAVRTAQGAPIPGAMVRLLQLVWVERSYERVPQYAVFSEKATKSDGSYQFEYVLKNDDPDGPFMIEAVNPVTNEVGQIMAPVQEHGQRINLDVFMKAKGTVVGVVRDEAGNAVPNASVQLDTLSDNRQYFVVTDASGSFSFTNIRVGAFRLKAVSVSLFAEGVTMGTLPEDGGTAVQDITIYKAAGVPKGNVVGKVLGMDGIPRSGAIVIVRSGEKYQNWMRSGSDGGFSFTGVFAGAVSVEVRDQTIGETALVTGTLAENTTSVFNVILKGAGTLECLVVREDGLSPEGFTVIASIGGGRAAVTDASGFARFDNVPVGSNISVYIPDPRYQGVNFASGNVVLQNPGETSTITLFIPVKSVATGSIRGTVRKRNGSIWPNAVVRLVTDLYSNKYKPYKADEHGVYVIPDPDPTKKDVLPIGVYYLIVQEGAEIANAQVSLWYNGQVKTQDLTAAGMGTVTGTIYDASGVNSDGTPNIVPAGADVQLASVKPNLVGWLMFDPGRPTSGKSDPQTGRYLFNGIYTGNVTVTASNIFKPTPVSASGMLTSNDQVLSLDLTLKDTFGSISGTVLLPDGRTRAGEGVRVTVRYSGADVTVTTGPDGKFQFMPVIPAGSYAVNVEDPVTTLKALTYVMVPAGRDVPVDIRLLGRGAMRVRVVDASGQAAAGAQVEVKGSSFPQDIAAGITDQSGSVTFYNLTEGNYAVSAKDSNNLGGRAQGIIPADNASVTATVTLAPSGTVTGRFLRPDGATVIAGGQIKLLNPSRQVIAYGSSSSDPANPGVFRFEYVPLGDFTLEGFDPLTDRKGAGGGRLTANSQTASADVIVTAQGTVTGTVLNNAGSAPVDNAKVSITVSGVSTWSYNTVSAPDGSFVFAGVPAGKFTLTARDPDTNLSGGATGSLTYEGEIVRAEIRLQPSGSIAGTVFMPDGVTPAQNVAVNLNPGSKIVQVDEQGFFSFSNLAAGTTYYLTAAEQGTHRVKRTSAVVNYEGEVAKADMTLNGVGVLEGYVYDSDGSTVLKGAKVVLYAAGAGSVTSLSATAYTHPDTGLYRFTDVPVGTFTLNATYPNKQTAASASGSITKEGEVANTNLTLGPVANVAGTVLKADGVSFAAGGGVRLTCGGKTFSTIIDSSGRFLFTSVPVPCSLTIYLTDAEGIGIGYYHGSLTAEDNGATVDTGTTVLDDKAIEITDISPQNGAVDLPLDTKITITFSEPADPATVNTSTMYLKQGSAWVWGAVSLSADRLTATFTPNQPLASFTLYTFTVTTGVKDRVGRALPNAFTSTFTTRDSVPPTVISVSPANAAVQVAIDSVVRMTFSESIDPASTGNIKLLSGGSFIETRLDLTQGNTVAVLTPMAPLMQNAAYTISVSGVKDAVGNMMAGAYISTFATIDIIAPTVFNLTTSGDMIKGNTISVAAAVADSDVAFVDFFVDGRLAATDYAAPYAASILLSREGAVQLRAVAQDKVGNRSLPYPQPDLEITVAPDQTPSIAVTSPANSVTVDSGRTFTVYVQATDDLSVKEIAFTAAGAATSNQTRNTSGKNVSTSFSVSVPSSAERGSLITITVTAKDSAGQLSSPTVITLTVRDGIAPTVSIASPGQSTPYRSALQEGEGTATVAATDNAGLADIICHFFGSGTIGAETFTLPIETGRKEFTASFTFPIRANADPNAQIILSCEVWDLDRNHNSSQIVLPIMDGIPPAVAGVYNRDNGQYGSMWDGMTGVPLNAAMDVVFSEPVAAATVNDESVFLAAESIGNARVPVQLSISGDRRTVTVLPPALDPGTTYRLMVTTGLTDQAGNSLSTLYALRFTTGGGGRVIRGQGTSDAPYRLAAGEYEDLTIINSTVLIEGPISAANIAIQESIVIATETITANTFSLVNHSVLTHMPVSESGSGSISIDIAATMMIDQTSRVDVSGKGYPGGFAGWNRSGYGLTAALDGRAMQGSALSNGGTYAGFGGIFSSGSGTVNNIYGNIIQPSHAGSGGGGYDNGLSGGSGGGFVQIMADELILNGQIIADGESRLNDDGAPVGAGSGGGIVIYAWSSITGSGTISARGGSSSFGGAGGGGRISVSSRLIGIPENNVSAPGGRNTKITASALNGGAGTVHLAEWWHLYRGERLIIDNDGTETAGISTLITGLSGSGIITDISLDSMTDSSASWIPGTLIGLYLTLGTDTSMFTIYDNTETTIFAGTDGIDLGMYAGVGDQYSYGPAHEFRSLRISGRAQVRCNGPMQLSESMVVDNASFEAFSVSAKSVSLINGAILSHPAVEAGTNRGLELWAYDGIIIDALSRIDVSGKGYRGGYAQDNSESTGRTSGNTTAGGSAEGNGGSYGGMGGTTGAGMVNAVYGNVAYTDEPGSGGGGKSGFAGGSGGGLVKIYAYELILEGAILADGESKNNTDGTPVGAGSGGAVFVSAWGGVSGSGSISAKGGSSSFGGAGGGGRISIERDWWDYRVLTVNLTATGGVNLNSGSGSLSGGAGTIFVMPGDLIINGGNVETDNITPISSYSVSNNFYGGLQIIGGAHVVSEGWGMDVFGGDLRVINSTLTVAGDLFVAGDIILNENAVLNYEESTLAKETMLFITATNILIDSSSRIDATAKGYAGGYSGDNGQSTGRTYGNTTEGGSTDYAGGAYGGLGGFGSRIGHVSNIYGDLSWPAEPGSGGGSIVETVPGGNGGGLVMINALSIMLDGAIIADGGQSTYGAGSGGGITIEAADIAGAGFISARGGESSEGGAGGGGRIAIYYYFLNFPINHIIASGGKNLNFTDPAYQGGAGTIYLQDDAELFGDLIIDNRGTKAFAGSTPLRSIGRGTITNISEISQWEYRLTDAGASWQPGSLIGLVVNPNINQDELFYVNNNDETNIMIATNGMDISQLASVGDTYAGVYHFRRIQILGGADVMCRDRIQTDMDLLLDNGRLAADDVSADQITLLNGGVLAPY